MLRAVCAKILVLLVTAWSSALSADQGAPRSGPDPVTAALADKTIRFASDEYGAGVLFIGQDGSAFLWFPRHWEIVRGQWSTKSYQWVRNPSAPHSEKEWYTVYRICFQFSGAPLGILTGKRFGSRTCFGVDEIKAITQEAVEGDVLKLRSEEIPCRACRSDIPLSRLKNRVGG